MWDEGYGDADARVDTIVVDTAAKSAPPCASDPKWPTVVGRISISGNERVSERTIRNSLTLEEGRPYKRQELITSQRNLYESNLFRRAVIIVPPQGDSIKHIEITVQEAPLREIRASAGFNTYEFGQVETRLTRYNWFGGGRRLDFRAAVGNIAADALNARFPFQEVLPYRCRTPTPINTSRPPGRQAPTSRSRGSSRRETRLAPASSVTARARRASS